MVQASGRDAGGVPQWNTTCPSRFAWASTSGSAGTIVQTKGRGSLGQRAVPHRGSDANTRTRFYVSPSVSIVRALPMSPRWVRT